MHRRRSPDQTPTRRSPSLACPWPCPGLALASPGLPFFQRLLEAVWKKPAARIFQFVRSVPPSPQLSLRSAARPNPCNSRKSSAAVHLRTSRALASTSTHSSWAYGAAKSSPNRSRTQFPANFNLHDHALRWSLVRYPTRTSRGRTLPFDQHACLIYAQQ